MVNLVRFIRKIELINRIDVIQPFLHQNLAHRSSLRQEKVPVDPSALRLRRLHDLQVYFLQSFFYGFHDQILNDGQSSLPQIFVPSQKFLGFLVLSKVGFEKLDDILNFVEKWNNLAALFFVQFVLIRIFPNNLVIPFINFELYLFKLSVIFQVRFDFFHDRVEHALPVQNRVARFLKV